MSESTGGYFYDRTAEYVAVLLPGAWVGLRPALTAALAGLDPAEGPVVDVGAGSGEGVVVLADALPGAEIIAIEPHAALRTALLTRILTDPALAERVTVLAGDVLSAPLPDRIGGLIAMNMIGHLTPGDRRALWAVLAAKLAPGGRAVVSLYPPHEPEAVLDAPMGAAVIGRRRYSGSAAAEPAGPDSVTWHMTYRVEEDGQVVTEFTASDRWYVLTPSELADELAEHGLRVSAADTDQGLQIITW